MKLAKFSPWTKDFNRVIGAMRAGLNLWGFQPNFTLRDHSNNTWHFTYPHPPSRVTFQFFNNCFKTFKMWQNVFWSLILYFTGLFSGGLIYHYFHDPIHLEITQDYKNFVGIDDSDTKLSIDLFMVIFIFLSVGLVIGLIVLLLEIWCQFHQHFTCSFYLWRSQMHKKDSQVVCLFYTFWIWAHKSCS